MSDLFQTVPKANIAVKLGLDAKASYSAKDIEVLEGLEPVRRRPGMYIGGTDETAMHHLAVEILDNAMDEAVAGFATRITLELLADGSLAISDNGRGIPVDPHPKFPDRSALEVIMTTLHSGGKFNGEVYQTSGGLHGVGLSVVNALADTLIIEVAREKKLWRQHYARGKPLGPLEAVGSAGNRRGTLIRFHPDPEIFAAAHFRAATLYRLTRSKAYLYRGVELEWRCDPAILHGADIPPQELFHFPNGLDDYLASRLEGEAIEAEFTGTAPLAEKTGRLEWAIAWTSRSEGQISSYCNTIPTAQGGTHEAGMRNALTRALKLYGERVNNRRAGQITSDDVLAGTEAILSLFMREPQFQGQTKEKLVSAEAGRLVETSLKDYFEHFLTGNPAAASALLDRVIERAEERIRRRETKEFDRQSATRRLRLPGKLTDCTVTTPTGTEIFLVEGDSAGGSAKQARRRETQAILPLRGKILNVASASADKLKGNQELHDLALALGCGIGERCDPAKLRYERVIIMTDADVDGAHIAALLMTFFYREMRPIILAGHLFLAQPPLYRLAQGGKSIYVRDDVERLAAERRLKPGTKFDISRFKGLGEMPPAQLKETTMDPASRTLLRVQLTDEKNGGQPTALNQLVESLMGRRPEHRFAFIRDNAKFAQDLDL